MFGVTVKRIIGGASSFKIEDVSIYNVSIGAPVSDIVDFDDSSMYQKVMGTPVLFTTTGVHNLTEEQYEIIKPYCIDGLALDLSKLPEGIEDKLNL